MRRRWSYPNTGVVVKYTESAPPRYNGGIAIGRVMHKSMKTIHYHTLGTKMVLVWQHKGMQMCVKLWDSPKPRSSD